MERWPVEPEPSVGHVGSLVTQHLLGRRYHALQQGLLGGRERLGVGDVLPGHDQVVVLGRRLYVPEHDQVLVGGQQLRAAGVVAADLAEDAVSRHGVGGHGQASPRGRQTTRIGAGHALSSAKHYVLQLHDVRAQYCQHHTPPHGAV